MSSDAAAMHSMYPIGADVLEALALHRIMTTHQVHRLLMADKSAAWCRKVLGDLKALGYADSMTQRQNGAHRNLPAVWWATDHGVRAARDMPSVRQARIVTLNAAKVAAGTQLHTLAVNEVAIIIAAAARDRGDNATWLNEVGHRVTSAIGPDQYATADAAITLDTTTTGGHDTIRILLELDRGTKPYDRIAEQMRRYLLYRRLTIGKPPTPAWHTRYPPIPSAPLAGFPMVMWVFDCDRAEGRLETFAELVTSAERSPDLAAAGSELWLMLTTAECLAENGPYGPTFTDPYTGRAGLDITGNAATSVRADRRGVRTDRRRG